MGSLLAQIIRDVRLSRHGVQNAESLTRKGFQVYNNFCASADRLREQFEKKILSAVELNDGLTPLLYAYCPDGYQFLTASTERMFSVEIIDELLNSMQAWAAETLGMHHVSTPQLRVFLNGCYRDLMRDDVQAGAHWILWLAHNGHQKIGRVTLATPAPGHDSDASSLKVDGVASIEPEFNQLLVHNSAHAYGIEMVKSATDPAHGAVFIDGYFW